MAIQKRRTEAIYYECTNFYFETEEAEGDEQFSASKENSPLPIVETGLFIDRGGIPPGLLHQPWDRSEQPSLIPPEKKLMENPTCPSP